LMNFIARRSSSSGFLSGVYSVESMDGSSLRLKNCNHHRPVHVSSTYAIHFSLIERLVRDVPGGARLSLSYEVSSFHWREYRILTHARCYASFSPSLSLASLANSPCLEPFLSAPQLQRAPSMWPHKHKVGDWEPR
jgi:hypothetical protein